MEKWASFRIFWICGLASVLVDLDHAISLLLWWHITPEISEGRIWHTPLFIISCILICYMVSYLRGLYLKLVLVGGVIVATTLVLVYSPYIVWRLT